MSKRKVPDKDILLDLYLNQKLSAGEIGRKYNVTPNNVLIQLKKYGADIRKDAGENHHAWKGGKIYNKGTGYIGVWKPDHPRADGGGYVYEHTLVIEKTIGRLPNKDEMIHHIDLNKHNNNIENLLLCTYKEHQNMHVQLDKLQAELIQSQIIKFDKDLNKYYIA